MTTLLEVSQDYAKQFEPQETKTLQEAAESLPSQSTQSRPSTAELHCHPNSSQRKERKSEPLPASVTAMQGAQS